MDWWLKTLKYKTVGLPDAEIKQYETELQAKTLKDQCEQCYEYRDWLLNYSPTVVFMMEELKNVNSDIKPEKIFCDECDGMKKGGGFHPEKGILLCQNYILDKYHLEDTLSHELVHAYDNAKFKVDWLNLKHHACSEIRASSLSGECRIMAQFWRAAISKFAGGHQECVKRRAVLSVQANPNCKSKEQAEGVVDEVWQSCFNDTRPFEQIYR